MKIALDYDKTYSAAPEMWERLIAIMEEEGHEVRIVTARDERYDRTAPLLNLEGRGHTIVWTRGCAKRWWCQHFAPDFVPDVWIDDKPESVLSNSDYPP